jgi:site-specific recombinase XerC
MGELLESFNRNPFRLLRKKRQISRETERRKLNRLRDFLEFCERQGRRKFTQIQQKDWTNFCRHKRQQGLGDESMRQYALVVREFARRAHIDLRVNPSNFRKKRQKARRQGPSAS